MICGISEGVIEHYQIGAQGVLIHLRNSGEPAHGEEQDSASDGHRGVGLSSLLNLLGCLFTDFYVTEYLNRHLLCVLQSFN